MAKKPRYYVDLYDDAEYAEENPHEWKKFTSLKKAVRYAIEHELTEDRIIDPEGNPIPDLNLDDPQWWNHRRLETEYRNQSEMRERLAAALAREQDAYRNRQVTMIQAGYVPIELITKRLINAEIHHHGIDHAQVILTLDGCPGETATEHGRSPFTAFLTELQNGIDKL